jgi:glutathione S-transferase
MIDFHYWPTPNGWKVAVLLDETGLPDRMVPIEGLCGRTQNFGLAWY